MGSKDLIIMALRIVNSLLLLVFLRPTLAQNSLSVGFYNAKCSQAESIVRGVITSHYAIDQSLPAALLRMHFHDCFVKGCDGSILIDSVGNNVSEKEAGPNLTVRGFEIIDEAKALLESACPGVVSCADIIALATRDAVSLAGGQQYNLPTGRRDGRISSINNVNLPAPSFQVSQAAAAFAKKGLTLQDMVILLGAHTVGVAHCSFFSDRLYNFQGSGTADPSMDATLVASLKNICPSPTSSSTDDPTVFLDQNTSFAFDNSYYQQLQLNHGILQIDQELTSAGSTKGIVTNLASDGTTFSKSFAGAMIKMGNIGVLTGKKGEIRTNCRVVNPIPSKKKSSKL
eukprot:PITA_21962